MKRLIKKSEIYDAIKTAEFFNGANDNYKKYQECFINPTAKEFQEIQKNSATDSIRAIITSDGTLYAWSGEVLHVKAIPLFDIPQDYLRLDIDRPDSIYISITPNITPEVLKKIFTDNSYLYNFVDSNARVGFYTDFNLFIERYENMFSRISDIINYNDKSKIGNLIKKSTIYDGFKIDDEYYEVFKNPSSNEIEAVKKADPNSGIRGIIDPSGNVYIWPAEISHYNIDGYVNIPVDYFRFVYEENGRTPWIFDLQGLGGELTIDDAIEIIKNNISILQKIGDMNKKFSILANGKNEFLSSNNLNNELQSYTSKFSRKIKSELFDAFQRRNDMTNNYDYYEIFKNPSAKEIQSIKNDNNGAVRGVILDNGDMYIWSGYILHPDIHNNIDISKFRFAYEPGCWLIDAHNNYSLKDLMRLIESYKSQLSQIGNFNEGFDIVYCKDNDPPMVAMLEEIKKWIGESNDEKAN